MLAVASLKRSLEFDPVQQGVKRKRAELKLSPSNYNLNSSKQQQQQQQPSLSSPKRKISTDDTPMFTNAQTTQMCVRLLRDQDEKLRQQYEDLLKTKLNEQYERFIRYSNDSVYQHQVKSQDSKQQMDFSYVS